jgi:hypothetical protein
LSALARSAVDANAVKRGDVVVEPPAQALVEPLSSVDVGHGDDVDLEVHVDLPDGRAAAGVVYFGSAHCCLLGCAACMALAFSRKTSWVFVLLMPSTVTSAPARRAR